ncbi:breast cancer anti-estrogen resistance protein 1 isoform X2 [Dunckerocampus dactyliophorus]|uniref:breast cancer anti-estrogen resistance protein 1 isoform X2 n=1 Tax=Dunckerocampus dactyliophorus TaxID=161453 RepID=UPI002405BC2A|nr:breast cancer anti-estrogen resistance protein 1 isoform X2 [Dunckerocampus dactyliophorus]
MDGNVLAKALYDNVAESPDELSFRKGDILTVLERNTQGLDGWWLCSLHGRQGIVPGNRLKILVGMHDGKEPGIIDPASSCPTSQLQRLLHPKPALAQYTPMPSIYSTPSPAKPKPDPVYMIPPKHGPKPSAHILYQASSDPSGPPLKVKLESSIKTVGPGTGNDLYQVPPTLEKRTWEDRKPLDKVVVSTQACDTVNPYKDKYDLPPRHQMPSRQDIYDVPPIRDQYNTQVYDFPPTVSKDVPDTHLMKEETYDVPSHLSRTQTQAFTPEYGQNMASRPNNDIQDNPVPEDVYDVPPPLLSNRHLHGDGSKVSRSAEEIYDIPASLRTGGHSTQGVYDIPREQEEKGIQRDDAYIYDVPPQVIRDGQVTSEELHMAFKRLSASSTGSTLSNQSASSLDMHGDTEPSPLCFFAAKPLLLDLEKAMERLSRLQQAVDLSVSMMMSIITGNWRSPDKLEGNIPALHQAANGVCATLRDFLEFSHGAVANAGQATDRSLQNKLAQQVGNLEEVFQSVIAQTQSLDAVSWTELTKPQPGGDVLDQLIITARGIPEDTKQLTSFLHGNASLLFKQSHQSQLPPLPGQTSCHVTGSGSHQMGEKMNIQSRPLPAPPKFAAAEEDSVVDNSYETTEGWMEDYDYVHLQMKQSERQEVGQPINKDLTGWVHLPQNNSSSRLCRADRQLLLFYLEQSEQNFTSVNDAIVAFSTAVNSNQLPKIFVAHSKFVIIGTHKLVFIGDTLSRQAKSPQVRAQIGQTSSTLCSKLKDFVISTKTASLQYPSPGASREMSERVMELAGCTQQFKMVLGQLLMV